jgi:phasin family protein
MDVQTMATAAKTDDAKAALAAEKAYAAAAQTAEVVKAPASKAAVAAPKVVADAPKSTVKSAAKPAKAAPSNSTAPKVAAAKAPAKKQPKKLTVSKLNLISQPKAKAMTKTTTEDFTAKITTAVAEAQDKAKAAFEKGQTVFAEAGEFTKGNVEALVESGKILAAGLQTLGKDYVAEGKTAFETMTADVKELAAIKSPADFFKLQSEILRRNFDAVVATGSKQSEVVVKLAGDTFAPISSRVSLAVEKVKKAA